MKKHYLTLLLFFVLSVVYIPEAKACFGDKLGFGYLKGTQDEFSTQLIAIYIKEKTGIDSVVNEFATLASAEKSLKKDETDIIVLTGPSNELDNEKLAGNHKESRFFTLVEVDGNKVVLRVAKKRLEDIKFFTLNKVMDRVHKIIKPADFKASVARVKSGEKFPKQEAREYLVERDLI
jgi:hypothetical protein